MPSRRLDQLGDQIRDEVADLMRRELRDPGLSGIVSITEVEVSTDLKYARVFVSALGGDEERQAAVAALTRAAGFLRRELGKRLHIRQIPELLFRPDASLERGERILGLLRQIESERGSAPAPDGASSDGEGDSDREP
jgi:ribosome-binding factor A